MSLNGDRCRDKIVPLCVLEQKFVFYFGSKVTSLSQKFKTKRRQSIGNVGNIAGLKGSTGDERW